ncbi:MAG: hydroxymethylbilane synthase [Bryobacteraceae bacterium]
MIVIGSRGSQLALWQAHHIAQKLNVETRIEIIKTTGDKIQDVPLSQVGGKGLFTKEIEEALLDGRIDLAVHSLKDMPSELPAGLTLAAIPEREDPRDALIGAPLKEGARVGTSSLRRSVQLMNMHHGLKIEMLRGNVDTRLRKLDEGQYDTIILAAAGLRRLGLEHRIAEYLAVDAMIPAVGQGALAIETRDDNGDAHQLARTLEHKASRIAITAERAFLAVFGGSCQVPIGAHATLDGEMLHLRAFVSEPDGSNPRRGELTGTDPIDLGGSLAMRLK